jgi:hypothetical protein
LGFAVTANWFSPRELLLSVGGFDAKLKSGGDSQLSKALGQRGYQLAYAHNVVVRHPARAFARELYAKRRRVLGGNWNKSKLIAPVRLLGHLYLQLTEAVSRCKRILLEPSLEGTQRVRTMSLVAILWVVSVTELMRLALGYEPRR